MTDKKAVIVYFGGQCREIWSGDGLNIAYTGRLAVLATREGADIWRASAPEPGHTGNIKSDYNAAGKERELAALLNSDDCPALTHAYFSASATAATIAALHKTDIGRLPKFLSYDVFGGFDALILPELFRLLLDEHHLSWEEASSLIARCFIFHAENDVRTPLTALAALSPRVSRLVETVNDKLRKRLWRTYPGDWQRIASGAAVSDGEVDFGKLCAAMCGRIICPKSKIAETFRTLFVSMPGKFEDCL